MSGRRQLVIMLKEPRPGRVKSRLGRGIGMVPAAWWFRHQSARLIRRVGRDPRWRTYLAVSPDVAGCQSRVWPGDLPRMAQGGGDLGARMRRVFSRSPPGPVVIIGADIPGVTASHVARAFAALGQRDAVLGPASDGGYWLVGLARRGGRLPPGLFKGVRWSGEHALADTLQSLAGLRIALIEQLDDVDTAEDLRELAGTRP